MRLTLRRRHLFPLDGCWSKACQRLVLAGTLVLTGCLSESSDSVTSADDKSELLLPKNSSTQSTPFIYPGIQQPATFTPEEIDLSDTTMVVGIVVGDEARAYVLNDMAQMTTHVVNDFFTETAVSVTYCNRTNVVRVFTKAEAQSPLNLMVGGWKESQMIVHVDGVPFLQESAEIPLEEYPFERTSLIEWKLRYPRTRIYTHAKR